MRFFHKCLLQVVINFSLYLLLAPNNPTLTTLYVLFHIGRNKEQEREQITCDRW